MFEFLIRFFGVKSIFDELLRFVKVRLINYYVDGIDAARRVFLVFFIAVLFFLMFCIGLLILHVALFLTLPWSLEDRITLMAILGSIYVLVPMVLIIILNRRLRWLKLCGVKELIETLPPR